MEICQGLQDYFDVMLGTQLLYKFERPQYSDVSTIVCILFLYSPRYQILQSYPDKTPSDIYGIEHFLRLFGICLYLNSLSLHLFSPPLPPSLSHTVRLGSMLGYTAIDEDSLSMLQTHIQELLG